MEKDPRKTHRNPTHAQQLIGASLESTPMTFGRNKSLQLSMVTNGAQQENDQFNMEIDDSRCEIQLSPIRSPSSHITYFLQPQLHIDTQSPITMGVVLN